LGIEEPSLEWCLRPENQHAFCEDFDHDDPFGAWEIKPTPPEGAARAVAVSDDSPPNLLDTSVQAITDGGASITGLETPFSDREFDRVVVSLDVRIVTFGYLVTEGMGGSGIGFLLVEDAYGEQDNLCVGLALTGGSTNANANLAIVVRPSARECFTVDRLTAADDAGGADGGTPPFLLGEILVGGWNHIVLDVRRDPSGDGSGTIQPTVRGFGTLGAVPIPAGSLGPGYPQLGIATSVSGPVGNVEIQFDNVTVDFPPN